jgi:Effector-associated domain 9
MERSKSSHKLQLENLQTQLAQLDDEYQATMRQFDCNLAGADRTKLETRLAGIDRQMSEVEREIRWRSLSEGESLA